MPFHDLVRPLAPDPLPAVLAASAYSGHLRRLSGVSERLQRLEALGPAGLAEAACAAAMEAAAAPDPALGMRQLRDAKADIHLACAAADLAGAWTLEGVTGALSRFADLATAAALALAARRVDGPAAPAAPPGLIVLAMGKLGAGELNYSSDIDLTVFYDPALLGPEAKRRAVRITQAMAQILEERTAEGYVFRVDLRLRPDPASTPAAVSVAFAEDYYQSLGQNWERAAFIKARPVAGDLAAGEAFLASLRPFRWRRHLDYAAIADIRSIKRQIVSAAGDAAFDDPVFDLKRDRGGIRDVELLAQTQQLILGGRYPELREPTTVGALAALALRGVIASSEAETLEGGYRALRAVEHRLQMLEDEQTHAIPAQPQEQARLAALCGRDGFAVLSADLASLRRRIAAIDANLFSPHESLADPMGALSFTGVEDDPATLATLRNLGFQAPEQVTETVRGWHHGRVRATRSQRARELLTELTPALLRALSETGDADAAFRSFAAFLGALPAGVQTLSLFANHPPLLRELANVFAAAPRLAAGLGQRPGALDSLLEPRAQAELADGDAGAGLLRARLLAAEDFERQLDEARRFHRDEALRIALHLLAGRIDGPEAGLAHTRLADTCIQGLFAATAEEFARRGRLPEGRMALLGLGKLGGRELAAGSDLDVMLVYEAASGQGPEAFARFTQALIAALSAPTAEGPLYAIDMQLRPSGSKGPIAVRLSSFVRYYEEEAWTWELLALTRLRLVAGDAELGATALAAAQAAFARPRDAAAQAADVLAMRAKMDAERPAKGLWDLKLSPGGLVDLEFAVQARMLAAARRWPDAVAPNTGAAIARLAALGALTPAEAETLATAWRRLTNLSQLIRVAVGEPFRPEQAPARLREALARLLAVPPATAHNPELGVSESAHAERGDVLETLQQALLEDGPRLRAVTQGIIEASAAL